jgi:high-affinity K+ transport system ATPase subunit B
MAVSQLILAVNTAGTLAIGAICFFIVYTTFKGIEDKQIQEFSKRFMMAIAVLILYVSYFITYNAFFPESTVAQYPLYLILVFVFIYMVYAAIGFEKVAESYGVSQSDKLEKMEKEEIG